MTVQSTEALIAESRERAALPTTGSNTAQCLREAADALEAATGEIEHLNAVIDGEARR